MMTKSLEYRHVRLARKMTKGGSITIPVQIRREFGFRGRDLFTIEVDRKTGDILLKRVVGKCILTGETENLVEVNGRYISFAALEEINANLTGGKLLEELMPGGVEGDLLEAKLREDEIKERRELKERLKKSVDEAKLEDPMTVKIKDVYDTNGNLVVPAKDNMVGKEVIKKAPAKKKTTPNKKAVVEPKVEKVVVEEKTVAVKPKATKTRKAKRIEPLAEGEQLEIEDVNEMKRKIVAAEVEKAVLEAATVEEEKTKVTTRKSRRGIRG